MHGRAAGLEDLPNGTGNDVQIRWRALRRRILVVAKHQFARFGYEGVSLDDVAHGADLPVDELRLHFEGKHALFMTILEESWESVNLRLEDIVLNALSTRDAMLSLLALMMNVVQNDEDTARLLLSDGCHPDPDSGALAFSAGYRRFQRACTALVQHGQRFGGIKESYHPQVVATMLVGLLEGLIRDRLFAEQETSFTPYTGSHLLSPFEAYIASLAP